jgi:hypothetical protein
VYDTETKLELPTNAEKLPFDVYLQFLIVFLMFERKISVAGNNFRRNTPHGEPVANTAVIIPDIFDMIPAPTEISVKISV